MAKAAGAHELQRGAESTGGIQQWQKRHLSAAYSYLLGRGRGDRLCADLHHRGTKYFLP